MLRLNCFFQAKEGRLDDALAAAKELTAASLKQDGCIAYDVFASATRPGGRSSHLRDMARRGCARRAFSIRCIRKVRRSHQ